MYFLPQRDINQLKLKVREMREKNVRTSISYKRRLFNIKTDRSGITDIEFIAQYLILANAPANPILTKWSDMSAPLIQWLMKRRTENERFTPPNTSR